jgi:hypothetical protein
MACWVSVDTEGVSNGACRGYRQRTHLQRQDREPIDDGRCCRCMRGKVCGRVEVHVGRKSGGSDRGTVNKLFPARFASTYLDCVRLLVSWGLRRAFALLVNTPPGIPNNRHSGDAAALFGTVWRAAWPRPSLPRIVRLRAYLRHSMPPYRTPVATGNSTTTVSIAPKMACLAVRRLGPGLILFACNSPGGEYKSESGGNATAGGSRNRAEVSVAHQLEVRGFIRKLQA